MVEHAGQRALRTTRHATRLAVAVGLLAAAIATVSPGALEGRSATAPGSIGPSPLGGHWQTFANGDRITSIARDGSTLWVGTETGGLIRWRIEERRYQQYLAPQRDLPSNDVLDVALGDDGAVWLATARGLSRFDPLAETFSNVTPASSPDMPAWRVTALEPDGDGRLWVGFAQQWDREAPHPDKGRTEPGAFSTGGLALYDPVGGTWSEVTHVSYTNVPGLPAELASIPSENVTDLELTPDGLLWVATRPNYVWEPEDCVPGTCIGDGGAWVLEGGGLAARDVTGDAWQVWYPRSDGTGSCYASHVTGLAADANNHVWVGTWGRGVMVMRNGLQRTSCAGQARYGRARFGADGLLGMVIWSLDVDAEGRVWMGHGDGDDDGRGIAVLDTHGTLDDWETPWDTDDEWRHVDVDGVPGRTPILVSAIDVSDPEMYVMGTIDNVDGDGVGVRLYGPQSEQWTALRTADAGLPSSRVSHIAYDEPRGQVWFSLEQRGVARYDTNTGAWDWWQAYANATIVANVMAAAPEKANRVPVSLADEAEYNVAFPDSPSYARFGRDPTLYEVTGYRTPRGGDEPAIYVTPRLAVSVPVDVDVFRVARGPASNEATQVDVADDGTAWVGGNFTLWREGQSPGSNCSTYPQCYIDGGVGRWDGAEWLVYNDANSELPRNGVGAVRVGAVEVGADGRVWAGTGDRRASGDGLGALETVSGDWTIHSVRSGLATGDGVADIDVDPDTGNVWTAHHPVLGYVQLPNGQQQRYFDGGGVARWNGGSWKTWTKPDSSIRAFGDKGIMESVLVDRVHGRVWAGGWDGDPVTYHWPKGKDVHAVVNWCPLDDCSYGDWQHKVWEDDGTVSALTLDAEGRVWAGTNRAGAGTVPPIAGVKLFDGEAWHTLTPDNSGLAGREISALERAGDGVWVGTLDRGASLYLPSPPPTPTPVATDTPVPTATPSIAPTVEATPTPRSSPTPSATPTATNVPATTVPTPTPTREPGCPGGGCRITLPFCLRGV